MKRSLIMLMAITALVVAMIAPASGITKGGQLDGNDHPYVGLMIAEVNGSPAWRCSGTLISPTVFVTAGHCTDGADGAQLWFRSNLEPNPARFGYPDKGEVTGTPYTHPLYQDPGFFLYDLGIVVLDSPVRVRGGYPSLPDVGQLDTIGKGRKNATVTAVGYGLQEIVDGPICVGPEDCDAEPPVYFDPKYQADKTRYQADLMVTNTIGVAGLKQLFGFYPGSGSFIVSGDAKHGGTCFGDSGGPFLLADGDDTVLIGVNSFGLNANCAGIGGAYRLDQTDDLRFINSFLR